MRFAHSSMIALLCCSAGCELVLEARPRGPSHSPAPGGETAPPPPPAPGPYDHLPQRTSFTTMANVELKVGCYVGDFVLGRSQLDVHGAGIGKTVIQGNLVLDTQCEVSNLTVTGDVVFKGSQATLKDVDFFGRVHDHGLQNRY